VSGIAIDYHLVARAEALAGEDVHDLANLLADYLGDFHLQEMGSSRPLNFRLNAERQLRAFVVEKQLRAADSQADQLGFR